MKFECSFCGAPTNNEEKIGHITLHTCYSCQERIGRETAWQSEGETWHEDTIICPYCGFEFDDYDCYQFEDDEDVEEQECPECGKHFDIEVRVIRYYNTKRSICDMP